MELWAELFRDWVGILSFGVIAFVIVMTAFFYQILSLGHIDDEQ